MGNGPGDWLSALNLSEVTKRYPDLRIVPAKGQDAQLVGTLAFTAASGESETISDEYEIVIQFPREFPRKLAVVRETGGRIPCSFHTNPDGTLCLGSPTRQLLAMCESRTAFAFIETCVVPYFYGYSFLLKHDRLPFGELNHGELGLKEDFAGLFGVKPDQSARMVLLSAMKKREANREPCPCGSGRRLGRCHNRVVNEFRRKLGRTWFQNQYQYLKQ